MRMVSRCISPVALFFLLCTKDVGNLAKRDLAEIATTHSYSYGSTNQGNQDDIDPSSSAAANGAISNAKAMEHFVPGGLEVFPRIAFNFTSTLQKGSEAEQSINSSARVEPSFHSSSWKHSKKLLSGGLNQDGTVDGEKYFSCCACKDANAKHLGSLSSKITFVAHNSMKCIPLCEERDEAADMSQSCEEVPDPTVLNTRANRNKLKTKMMWCKDGKLEDDIKKCVAEREAKEKEGEDEEDEEEGQKKKGKEEKVVKKDKGSSARMVPTIGVHLFSLSMPLGLSLASSYSV